MDIILESVFQTKEHAKVVAEWRADAHARAMSLHPQPMTDDEFWSYFSRVYFLLKDLPSVFAHVDGKRAAFIGFDPVAEAKNKAACISIIVAPDVRGKGIGSQVLDKVSLYAAQQGYDELYAEIKPENIASKRIFEKAGFSCIKKITKVVDGYSAELFVYTKQLSDLRGLDKVFIIAEAGSNWRAGTLKDDLARSEQLINAAKDAGCDAIKFQVYRADTVYVQNAGGADYMQKMGIEESVIDVFKHLSMPYEMIPELHGMCQKIGIEFMATPFSKQDFAAVDPYVSRHKMGSYELGHIRLLELAAKSQKPLIASTGVSEVADIEWAVQYYKAQGGKALTLLQCSSQYPAASSGMNLRAIPWMKSYFQVPVGLSDHSPDPITAPVAAVALGASVIEKHFTLDKHLPGPDHSFALEPQELKSMVQAIRECEVMVGSSVKKVAAEERELFSFARRGLQAIAPITKGDLFVEGANIAILRPGKQKIGVHPRHIDDIIGKKATRDIPLGDGVQHDDWQ